MSALRAGAVWFVAICSAIAAAEVRAQGFDGDWMISLTDAKRTLVGLLELEHSESGWQAHLEGGPARVEDSLGGDGKRGACGAARRRALRGAGARHRGTGVAGG